jgi:hypothetical protein
LRADSYFEGTGSGFVGGPKYGALVYGKDGFSTTNMAGISAGIAKPSGSLVVITPTKSFALTNTPYRKVFDETIDVPQLKKITDIEKKIEKAKYDTDESKLAGLKILLEEEPGIIVGEKYPTIFGEIFKLNLFLRMQKFA